MKCQITYSPEGAEPIKWFFEPGKMRNREAEEVETILNDISFNEWQMRVLRGFITDVGIAMWLHLRKTRAGLQLDQLDFSMSEIQLAFVEEDGDEDAAKVAEASEAAGVPKAKKKATA